MKASSNRTNARPALANARTPRRRAAAKPEFQRHIDAFDLAPIACISLDADQLIVHANLAAAELLGRDREGLPGANFRLFVAEHHRPALDECLAQALAGASAQSCAIDLARDKRPFARVMLSARGGRSKSECFVGMVEIGKGLLLAEDRPLEGEASLRNLARMTSDFYWQTDAEHRITVSEIFSKGSGVPTSQNAAVIGRHRWDLPALTPDAAGWDAHQATMEAQLPFRNFEFSRYGIDGIERHMSVSGEPMFDASGAFLGYRGLGRMTTERKLAERKLRESEERYRSLFDKAGDGILILSREGEIVAANEAFARMHGYSRQEIMNMRLEDLLAAETFRVAPERWARILAGELLTVEVEHRHREGHVFPVEISASVISSGNETHMQFFYRDVTQRKRTEAALLAANQEAEGANRAKTRFLAAASHDLRQPVQAINLFLDALAQTALSGEQKEMLGYLGLSVRGLRELLNALLDISQLDAGVVKPEVAQISAANLLRELETEFAHIAYGKGLRLRLFARQGLSFDSDPNLLLRALRNVIGNAIKYTENGGILICARARGAQVVFQVWDTGVGIAPEHIGRVFDEYFQIGNQARDRTKGIGLGLSIVERLIRLINGAIRCRSVPGRGSVFEISLPLVRARLAGARVWLPEADADSATIAAQRFLGRRVVLIEDDHLVAKAIEQALGRLGVTVVSFFNAEEALASSESACADLYISDFRLPGGMDGIELLDAIQRRSAQPINAVLMTGETALNQIELSASCSWKVLYKPVDLQALLSAM